MARLMRAVATIALAASLGGCASQTAPEYPGDGLALGSPGDVIDVTEDVPYYPACSNEVLNFDGATYFPFTPANKEDFPYEGGFILRESTESASAAGALGGPGMSVPFVVAPGPGDDVGTLTRFEEGFAYWISDSELISTWLTTTELTYSWAC